MRALVIEDDDTIAKLNQRLLEQEGFVVDLAGSVHDGSQLVERESYDLITLDMHLPDGEGFEILEIVRARSKPTPVLIVSGNDETETTVAALDAGADDYLNKPYQTSELRARVRAVMRRSGANGLKHTSCGNVVLNSEKRDAKVADSRMNLTPKEYTLLEYFAANCGKEITRKDLLEKVWRFDFDPGTNMIDVNISRLRAKLMSCGASCRIESVRGVGYMMRVEVDFRPS
jgi:Response regulators consisting of a CheY-like receiver domain and a winged-helix DNA-binding domain